MSLIVESTTTSSKAKESSPAARGNPFKGVFSHASSDIVASFVVFLIALPLCMGIAIASGAPPAAGIITGIVGGLVVGMFSGAPLQVSGPAAGLTVIVFEIVRELGLPMLGPVLLIAGLLQLAGGWLKLGRWFRAISPAVIYGMLSGIGILIVAGQFHVMVDDKPRPSGVANLLAIPESLIKGLLPQDGTVHHLAAAVGVATLAAILLWNRFRPAALRAVPGSLIGVLLGTGITAYFQLPIRHVDLPANLLAGSAWPTFGLLSRIIEPQVLLAAFTVAIVASAETLLSAAAVDRMHTGPRAKFDRELGAQGIGNILCGLLGGLPMTGVIVRSSANVQAGAKTRLSTILHGTWLLALVVLAPSVLRTIPTASLAAILVFTGFKLVEIHHIKRLSEFGRFPLVIYAATVAGTVIEDLLTGVLIGLGLSAVKVLVKATRLEMDVVSSETDQRVDITLRGMATFLRLPMLQDVLEKLPADRIVHLHVENLQYVDHACYEMLQAAAKQRTELGGAFHAPWDVLATRFHFRQLNTAPLVR